MPVNIRDSFIIRDLQSKSVGDLLMRAALLTIKRESDIASVQTECDVLLRRNIAQQGNRSALFPENSQELSGIAMAAAREQFGCYGHNILFPAVVGATDIPEISDSVRNGLCDQLHQSRRTAQRLVEQVNACKDDVERSELLWRAFMTHLWSGYPSLILNKYLTSSDGNNGVTMFTYISVALLMAYLAAATVFVAVMGVKYVGAGVVPLWLLAITISFALKMAIVEPSKICILSVAVPSVVLKGFERTRRYLARLGETVISRKKGVLDNALTSSNIQHINPACRAARSYPSLQISRLLISLKDADLPCYLPVYFEAGHHHKISTQNREARHARVHRVRNLVLYVFFSLPYAVQDVLVEAVLVAGTGITLVVLSYASKSTIIIPVVIAGVVLLILFVMVLFFTLRKVPKPRRFDSSAGIPLVWESDFVSQAETEDERNVGVGLGFDIIYDQSGQAQDAVYTQDDARDDATVASGGSSPFKHSSIGAYFSASAASETSPHGGGRGRGRGRGKVRGRGRGRLNSSRRHGDEEPPTKISLGDVGRIILSTPHDDMLLHAPLRTASAQSVRFDKLYDDRAVTEGDFQETNSAVSGASSAQPKGSFMQETLRNEVRLNQAAFRGRGRINARASSSDPKIFAESSPGSSVQRKVIRTPPSAARVNSGTVSFRDESIYTAGSAQYSVVSDSGALTPSGPVRVENVRGEERRRPLPGLKRSPLGRTGRGGRGRGLATGSSSPAVAPFDMGVMPDFGSVITSASKSNSFCSSLPVAPNPTKEGSFQMDGNPLRGRLVLAAVEKLRSRIKISTVSASSGSENGSRHSSPPKTTSSTIDTVNAFSFYGGYSKSVEGIHSLTRNISQQRIVTADDWFNLDEIADAHSSSGGSNDDVDDSLNCSRHPLDDPVNVDLSPSSEEESNSNITVRLSRAVNQLPKGASTHDFNSPLSSPRSSALQKAARLVLMRRMASVPSQNLSAAADTGADGSPLPDGPIKSYLPVAIQLNAALAKSRHTIKQRHEAAGLSASEVIKLANESAFPIPAPPSSAYTAGGLCINDPADVHVVTRKNYRSAPPVSASAPRRISFDFNTTGPPQAAPDFVSPLVPPVLPSSPLLRRANSGRLTLENVLKFKDTRIVGNSLSPAFRVTNITGTALAPEAQDGAYMPVTDTEIHEEVKISLQRTASARRAPPVLALDVADTGTPPPSVRKPISFDMNLRKNAPDGPADGASEAVSSPESGLRTPRLRLRDVMRLWLDISGEGESTVQDDAYERADKSDDRIPAVRHRYPEHLRGVLLPPLTRRQMTFEGQSYTIFVRTKWTSVEIFFVCVSLLSCPSVVDNFALYSAVLAHMLRL
jgi:hypothetical protein